MIIMSKFKYTKFFIKLYYQTSFLKNHNLDLTFVEKLSILRSQLVIMTTFGESIVGIISTEEQEILGRESQVD